MIIQLNDFDLEKISKSGQCFRMNQIKDEAGKYRLVAYGEYLEIEQGENGLYFSCTEEEWKILWEPYFDCGRDYGKIYQSVDKEDSYMRNAVTYGSGIRILHQELFEMIICFIISQQNNIPRIKKCVEALCSRFGEERLNFKGEKYHVFPTAQRLAEASLEELRECNLGYRSRYIAESARMIAEKEVNTDILLELNYEDAKKELMRLCGVGVKVAECICLFALCHTDAFPIDTHIQAVLEKYYPKGFPFDRYKGYAGILQQYAFYYDLSEK